MRGEDQGEIARRTGCGEVADFGFASAAEISSLGEIPMAGTQGRARFYDSRREAHHEQSGLIQLLRFSIRGAYDRRRGDSHQQFSKMDLINCDVVAILISCVGFPGYLSANVHLRRQADDTDTNAVFDA